VSLIMVERHDDVFDVISIRKDRSPYALCPRYRPASQGKAYLTLSP
jgi:hypothetical protein